MISIFVLIGLSLGLSSSLISVGAPEWVCYLAAALLGLAWGVIDVNHKRKELALAKIEEKDQKGDKKDEKL